MSSQIPLALIVGLVAGGTGAAAVTLLQPNASPGNSGRTAATLNDSSELLQQVRAMSETNATIVTRLQRLEAEIAMGAVPQQIRMPVSVDNEPIDLDAAVAAAVAKLSTSSSGAFVSPDFRKQVETVLELKAEEDRLAREQKRAQTEAQMLEDRLAKLQTDLGMDSRQVDGMRQIFIESDAKRSEMRDAMRGQANGDAPADFQTMRTQWQSLQDGMNLQIQGVLTPSQYEQYQTTNSDRGFGGGRGGFGGPAAGAGGGNGGGNNAAGGNNGGGRRRGGNG